jgi:hypothetical protein
MDAITFTSFHEICHKSLPIEPHEALRVHMSLVLAGLNALTRTARRLGR